ncbi:unnamed protein product [Ixodes pacificus]
MNGEQQLKKSYQFIVKKQHNSNKVLRYQTSLSSFIHIDLPAKLSTITKTYSFFVFFLSFNAPKHKKDSGIKQGGIVPKQVFHQLQSPIHYTVTIPLFIDHNFI